MKKAFLCPVSLMEKQYPLGWEIFISLYGKTNGGSTPPWDTEIVKERLGKT
jgi:hypothetical protein